VVHFRSGPFQLVGFVYRPNAVGPAPAVVYNHGSEVDPSLEFLGTVARFWQARGFVAFVPFRRGSSSSDGSSEGPYWQSIVDARPRAERDAATVEQLDAHVEDVLAAVGFLAEQGYVDRRFVAVGGCSFGGIETVLTAERAEAIYAGLDFAGASWTWASNAPLRERLTASARASRVPILFLQAENDNDTTPSKELSATMKAAGKPATLKIYPPYGSSVRDGHAGFCVRGMPYWGDDALAFLRDAALRALPSPSR
jgi:carboxymethylenebutenolidase